METIQYTFDNIIFSPFTDEEGKTIGKAGTDGAAGLILNDNSILIL
jgi:hypothetical protein